MTAPGGSRVPLLLPGNFAKPTMRTLEWVMTRVLSMR